MVPFDICYFDHINRYHIIARSLLDYVGCVGSWVLWVVWVSGYVSEWVAWVENLRGSRGLCGPIKFWHG